MARFLTAPRRQMVNPYPEVNVDFYSNLMGQAQQNLNQATQMQASAMEQAYNLPFTSQEDYEAIVTPMKERFEGMLDKEFVSPSEVARTIMDTRGEMQPRISALQNKAKELQMQRQLQTEWGLDWMGNDVSKMSITDTDPSQIKGINFNRKQIRDAFIQSKGAEFLKEIDSGRYQKLEGFPGENMYGRVITSGLSDQQKAMYAPGTELAIQNANEYFNSLPESSKQDLIAITGSPEAALQSIQQTQYEAVNDPRFAYTQKIVGAREYTPDEEENNFNNNSGSPIFTSSDKPFSRASYLDVSGLNEAHSELKANLDLIDKVDLNTIDEDIETLREELRSITSAELSSKGRGLPDSPLFRLIAPDKIEDQNSNLLSKRLYEERRNKINKTLDILNKVKKLGGKEEVIQEFSKKYMPEVNKLIKEDAYGPMVEFIKKNNPDLDDLGALNIISDFEEQPFIFSTISFNNKLSEEKLYKNLISSENSQVYDKELEREVKTETALKGYTQQDLESVRIDTESGRIEMVFNNKETGRKSISYDSSGGKTDKATKGSLETIKELSEAIKSYKSPISDFISDGTYTVEEINGERYIGIPGYVVKKDLNGNNKISKYLFTQEGKYIELNNNISYSEAVQKLAETAFSQTSAQNLNTIGNKPSKK